MALPELYKQQEYKRQTFDKDAEFRRLYGVNASKRDARKFNRYWNSDQRITDEKAFNADQDAAELAHVQSEQKKYFDSMDARIAAAREQNAARGAEALKKINASLAAKPVIPATKPVTETLTPRSEADWNRIASEATNGQLKTMADVEAWQRANGFSEDQIDGKFGNYSSSYFKSKGLGKYQTAPVEDNNSEIPSGYVELSRQDGSTFLQRQHPKTSTDTSEASTFDLMGYAKTHGLNDFYNHGGKKFVRHDPFGAGDYLIGEDGKIYKAGSWGKLGDEANESNIGIVGSAAYNNYHKVLGKLNTFKGIQSNKQGGTMNKIKYFQQGGVSPQQDIKAQIMALVQAAMKGDQKATQQVNQIMEAAKAGDQQAMQIAQIMEQVVKEMQGQAVTAKYGTKLDYLQSLKCGGKSKAKKKEQGGTVCPDCDKQVTKHQSGGVMGFYRDWSEGDIRKLQMFLSRTDMLGDDAYEGEYDGKMGPKTIAAIKAYQKKQGVTADGMWGTNTNKHHKVITSGIVSKSPYKNSHRYEAGNFTTYDVAGQKMKDQDYYKAINTLKEQFYANPEAFWNAGGNTAKWREHLYTTPEGTAIMEEFYSATPDDVRKKLGSRVTNRNMQQDQMDSGIREANGKVADVAVKKVLPAMAGIAAAPAMVMSPLAGLMGIGGSYIGGAAGRQVGENLSAGDTSAWTSVDGMGNVASVATPTSELVVPVTEAVGTALGGYAGYQFGNNAGSPSLEGMRAEHGKSPRLHNRKSTLRDYKPRAIRKDTGTKRPKMGYDWQDKPVVVLYEAPVGGGTAPVMPAESPINFENLAARKARGGSLGRNKYFSWI